MKQPTSSEMNKHHKLGVKKKSSIHNYLDEITRNLNRVSITGTSSQNASQSAHNTLSEWKQHVKDNDVFYFLSLTNQMAKGKLLLSNPSPQLDNEFYYMLGKYGSPPIYNLLRNSEFLEAFGTVDIQKYAPMHILEGIASADNHYMFDHLVNMNEFCHMKYSDIHQYALSLLENKSYKTMDSLIHTIAKWGDQQLKREFVSKMKGNMSRVIEQYDSRMITIIMKGVKNIGS